jgi:signal transduction histidine kinase
MEFSDNNDSIREFISIAVHDLREPLRAIRTSSELIATRCSNVTDETVTRSVRYVQEGVDRMESLIRDLSELCYEETREFSRVPVSLSEALREAQAQVTGQLNKNAPTVSSGPLPAVSGDGSALTILFRCLLDNSCKFHGDASVCIHVTADSTGGEWLISVRDNGIGFKPEYNDRIFKPFERLNGKKYPGSGLGLALAKRIVERHSGRIRAEGSPGQGTTIWFTLPQSPLGGAE